MKKVALIISFTTLSICLAAWCLFLCGCSSSKNMAARESGDGHTSEGVSYDIDNASIETSLESTPHSVQASLGDSVAIDAAVSVPKVSEAPKVRAQVISWTSGDIEGAFFKASDPIIQESDRPGSRTTWVKASSDAGSLSCGNGNLIFSSADFNQDIYAVAFGEGGVPDEAVYDEEELSFMPIEEAIKIARGYISALKITTYGRPTVRSLSALKLNEGASTTRKNYRIDYFRGMTNEDYDHFFDSNDETYVLSWHMQFLGIPLTNSSYLDSLGSQAFLGSNVEAWINKDGLVKMIVQNACGNPERQGDNSAIVPLDDAVNAVGSTYKEVMGTNAISISAIRFEYVSRSLDSNKNEVEFVPTWSFVPDGADKGIGVPIFVDAVSGEVF